MELRGFAARIIRIRDTYLKATREKERAVYAATLRSFINAY